MRLLPVALIAIFVILLLMHFNDKYLKTRYLPSYLCSHGYTTAEHQCKHKDSNSK